MSRNDSIESCSVTIIHEEVVSKVKENMLEEDTMMDLAQFFKVFSDPTRLNILHALSQSEMCVCDISALLNMNQSAVSHQLKVLRQSRLVRYRREGKVIYYSLDDEHIRDIFDKGLVHVKEESN